MTADKTEQPKPERITFYELKFYMFSNFSAFAVEFDGRLWPTSEHAYQGFKFDDYPTQERIRAEKSAHSAMKLAQSMADRYREHWDETKVVWMEQICRAKLEQHPYIQRKLAESGTRELIESSPIDSFWGWGPNKDGQNNLGKIWMKLRDDWNTRAQPVAQEPAYRMLEVGETIQEGDEFTDDEVSWKVTHRVGEAVLPHQIYRRPHVDDLPTRQARAILPMIAPNVLTNDPAALLAVVAAKLRAVMENTQTK